MRQIPLLLVLASSMIVPGTALAAMNVETDHQVRESGAEVSFQSDAEGDGWGTQTTFLGAFEVDRREALFSSFIAHLSQAAFVIPHDVFHAQPAVEAAAEPAVEVVEASPAASETNPILREGASTQVSGAATEDGVSMEAQADAAGRSVREQTAQPIPQPATLDRSAHAADPIPQDPAPEEAVVVPAPAAQPLADHVAPAERDAEAPLVASGIAAVGLAGSTLVFVPGSRTLVWRWIRRFVGLALFSRIAQEDILAHGRRAELFEFIKQNPGERIEGARRLLGLSNGSMHYHLKVLADRNLIRVLREGGIARMYPAGPKIQSTPYVPIQRKRVMDLLSARPGVTQREASALLGISERMTSYHVQTLASQGLVEVRPEGARKRLFLQVASAQPVGTR